MMTYAEFDELVPKLPCLWQPQWRWDEGLRPFHTDKDRNWSATISVATNYYIALNTSAHRDQKSINFVLTVNSGPKNIGYLSCSMLAYPAGTNPESEMTSPITEQTKFGNHDHQSELIWNQFIIRWVPYFRRSCWLSGCNIDCTAHEKLNWTIWWEQREQDYAMWVEEQAAKKRSD